MYPYYTPPQITQYSVVYFQMETAFPDRPSGEAVLTTRDGGRAVLARCTLGAPGEDAALVHVEPRSPWQVCTCRGMCAHPRVCMCVCVHTTQPYTVQPLSGRSLTWDRYTCACKNHFVFFKKNESLLLKWHSTAKLWRKNRQFERLTAHPGSLPSWWMPLPILGLMAPGPRQDVLQKWPVRAGRGLDRCFEFRALLQGEERH